MESTTHIVDIIGGGRGLWGALLSVTVLILFFVELWFNVGLYARIPRYRNSSRGADNRTDGISVIIVINDDYRFIEEALPILATQDYPVYEVVVVELGTTEDFSDLLSAARVQFGNIVTTRMEQDPRFPINGKMALNVGIKAASYENLIVTTADATPSSDKWLSSMARGFSNGDVVLGYCGMEAVGGFTGKWIRYDRFRTSVRFLSSAIRGIPYRGILQNFGFTRSLYFANKGFGYLNMNPGEDDLFVQRIADRSNTSIVLHRNAVVRQKTWGGTEWWNGVRKYRGSTYSHYSMRNKAAASAELFFRGAFFLSCLAALILMPMYWKLATGALIVLRWASVHRTNVKIRRRLGEPAFGFAALFHDLAEPFASLSGYISRKIKPAEGVYR